MSEKSPRALDMIFRPPETLMGGRVRERGRPKDQSGSRLRQTDLAFGSRMGVGVSGTVTAGGGPPTCDKVRTASVSPAAGTAFVTAPAQIVSGERAAPCNEDARSETNMVLEVPS